MNVATLTTIESILDQTRPQDATDYRTWGRLAGRMLAEYPMQAEAVLVEAMTARARNRISREQTRTRDGVARAVADSETGQLVIWTESIDPIWLRATGVRLMAEGDRKLKLGQRMRQAADCVEAHPGLTARDAWLAEGLDPNELDAVADEAVA